MKALKIVATLFVFLEKIYAPIFQLKIILLTNMLKIDAKYYEKVFQGKVFQPGMHIVGASVKNAAPPTNLIEFCVIYPRHAIYIGKDPLHEVVYFTREKDNTITANYTTLFKFANHKPLLIAEYNSGPPTDLFTDGFVYEDIPAPRLETVRLAISLAEEKKVKGCWFFGNHSESIAHACVIGNGKLKTIFLYRSLLDGAIEVKSDHGLQILWGNLCVNYISLINSEPEALWKAGHLIGNFIRFSEDFCAFHKIDEVLAWVLTRDFQEFIGKKDDTRVFGEHLKRVKKTAARLNCLPLVFFERIAEGISDMSFLAQYINETLLGVKEKLDLKMQVVHFLLTLSVLLLVTYYDKKNSYPSTKFKKPTQTDTFPEFPKMTLREVFPFKAFSGYIEEIDRRKSRSPLRSPSRTSSRSPTKSTPSEFLSKSRAY